MPEKLYTTGEVAKVLGVSYVAVKKWAYAGKIKYIKTPAGGTDIPRARSEDFLVSGCRKGKLPSTQGSARLIKRGSREAEAETG